jgi:4-oxalocrotonate tautomerase
MPIIEMHLMAGRTVEQKRAVAAAVAEAVTRTLGVQPEQVRLLITEHSLEEFSVGGVTAGDRLERATEQAATKENTQ